MPPLTSRNSTTQSDFLNIKEQDTEIPYAYFEMVKNQNALIAEVSGKVAGFMSYKEDYTTEVITGDYLPVIYISTVITDKEFRYQGITKGLYGSLFEKYGDKNIFTRTWSTNTAHTKLLLGMGFREFKRIPNDRGEGIDTVYYFRPQNSQG